MTAAAAQQTFAVERVFPNCRAHVWAGWSVRAKKAAWLGDPALEMDFRVGGEERSGFRDGRGDHANAGRYFEISEAERIVMACSMAVNGRVHTVSLATITFADESGGCRVRYTEQMWVIPPSDGARGPTPRLGGDPPRTGSLSRNRFPGRGAGLNAAPTVGRLARCGEAYPCLATTRRKRSSPAPFETVSRPSRAS